MNLFLKFFLILVGGLALLMAGHWWGVKQSEIVLYYPVYVVYAFHFVITTLLLGLLYFTHTTKIFYTGFAFLAGSFLKMLTSGAFFLPLILSDQKNNSIYEVISFIVPYFFCLFVETIFTIYLLKIEENQNKSSSENV